MKRERKDEKLALIAERLRRRKHLEDQKIREMVRQAHREVKRLLSQFLEIDPDLERVVLFGSLAEDRVVSALFDIDLAVQSREYLKLVACGLKSAYRVDVVDFKQVPDHIKQSIRKYGKVLYEKKKR